MTRRRADESVAYHRRVRRSPALLGVVGAALLLVAGCSDDGTDSAGATSTARPGPSTTQTTSASPTSDTTGPASSSDASASIPASTPTSTAPPPTAASIAAEITATERGIRDTSLSAESVAELGRRQQRAYRLLAGNTDLQDAVTALVPPDVATAFAFNVAARQAVVDQAARNPPSEPPPPTLPAWTIVEPRPIDELLAFYQEAETATGVPWQYLAAINFVETRMGRIRGESSAGALGPMQFLPETWAACCIGDIEDPRDAILGAATYLVSKGAPGDMEAALYGYNPNEGYVGAVTAYASNLMADPLAYRGYHAWEVYVVSSVGTVRLPVGYASDVPVDALEYVRTHPDDAA